MICKMPRVLIGKSEAIKSALACNPVDVASLRKLAISPGGLLDKKIRRRVWPHLLNVGECIGEITTNIKDHPYFNQVCMDVERSGGRFPNDMPADLKKKIQHDLTDLILGVLSKHPELHYYQGYHDICITFLFVCGKIGSMPLVEKLSTYYLRDFMDPTMDKTAHILNYLIPLLEKLNPNFMQFLIDSGVETVFAISWLITWFSYVLEKQSDIERLYDFFLSCHPLMPIYFSAQLILDNSSEIMNGECEMARVYQLLLNTARKNDLPLESLISKASDFYIQFPPSSLVDSTKYYKSNLAVSTFSDYSMVAKHELPDVVLRKRHLASLKNKPTTDTERLQPETFNYWSTLKFTAAAIGGAVGAAFVTAMSQVSDWGPQLFSYL